MLRDALTNAEQIAEKRPCFAGILNFEELGYRALQRRNATRNGESDTRFGTPSFVGFAVAA